MFSDCLIFTKRSSAIQPEKEKRVTSKSMKRSNTYVFIRLFYACVIVFFYTNEVRTININTIKSWGINPINPVSRDNLFLKPYVIVRLC